MLRNYTKVINSLIHLKGIMPIEVNVCIGLKNISNRYYLSLLLIVGFIFFSCNNSNSQNAKSVLTATEFADAIKNNSSAQIVDVRTAGEFASEHIANAMNIDLRSENFQSSIEKLDKSKPVYVYCLSGARSNAAMNMMQVLGFKNVFNLSGGILQWRNAKLPLTTDVASANSKPSMTLAQYNSLINSSNKILIDFYANWCIPCQKMKPYLEKIENTMKGKISIVRINADENQQLYKDLKLDGLPVLLYYNNKKLIWQQAGFVSEDELQKKLK